jgi:hypothetical protein
MSVKPSILCIFALISLLYACSGAEGPQPPPILAMYGDFEYAEYDTTWLQQLPVVTLKSEALFTDDELSEAGLQGAAAVYPLGEDKWIVHDFNTGAYTLEKGDLGWSSSRIGAVGQGPGEYENNRLMATMVADSTLWLNITGIRHLKYDLKGQYLGESTFRSTTWGTGITSTYTTANGNVFIHASEPDSMIVKYTALGDFEMSLDRFNQCIPRPLKQTTGGMGVYELTGYGINEFGEGMAFLRRYPFLIFFDVNDAGECHMRRIINIDPSNSDGTPLISTTAPGSDQQAWRGFHIVTAARPIDRCWIISTSAMAHGELLQVCSDGSMNRVQFLDLGGQPRGMNIANIYRGELFASYFLDGVTRYVKLE